MCGIAAIIAQDPVIAREALEAMVCAQTHRGPDDSGYKFIDLQGSTLGLGQRRLSIIDLSPLGHQPMSHPGTGDVLIYNGELYNFRDIRRDLEVEGVRFRGHSDTEVLLHALVRWGPSVLPRLRGMFTIVWYRRAERRLVIARDPLGIKPLYVARTPGALMFASEVRAIVASGLVERTISRRGLATFFAFGAVQAPDTIIEGVHEFPAGFWQEIAIDSALRSPVSSSVRYWRPPEIDRTIAEADALGRTRSSLEVAVRDHLISDVPVGVFLSGGIDSTVIAGLAAKYSSELSTYTVGFADNPDMSESEPAERTARLLGLRHHDVQISTAEALAGVERWLDRIDQPSIDGLNTFVVSKAVKEAGITVALSGLGGDELFCGYSSFVDVPRIQMLMRRTRNMPVWMRRALAWAASTGRPVAYRHKLMEIAQSGERLTDLYFQRRRVMSALQLAELGIHSRSSGLAKSFMPPEALSDIEVDEADPVAGVSTLETRFYTGNMLLRDSDAMGMAHSLEIRVPFFDTGVLESVMPIPSSVRMPLGIANKHLLRRAFPTLLRSELLDQPKRGFSLPIRRWMNSSLRGMCEESLADLRRSGLIEVKGIDSLWRGYLDAPETPLWSRAFALCVVGAYLGRVINRPATRPSASSPIALRDPLQSPSMG
ncbi:MAG: asparagine synthase (glutamine-hydrolyzing) [Phycisphaerae bacterium]|nr:asparagine synthase (glutamine-hydrolyzing) [Phycisphaerae bacterium]